LTQTAELALHSDRMSRHVKGVVDSIQLYRDTIQELVEETKKKVRIKLVELQAK